MGCMMPSVEGMQENRLQRASIELLGLPDSKRHPLLGTKTKKRTACQTSPLPATLCPLYLYTYMYPHESPPLASPTGSPQPCLLTDCQHEQPPLTSLGGALFHLKNGPPPTRKKAPPNLCIILSLSTPNQSFILHVQVAAMSTSPLPAILSPLYLYTYMSLPITSPMAPPKPSVLTHWQHAADQRFSLL